MASIIIPKAKQCDYRPVLYSVCELLLVKNRIRAGGKKITITRRGKSL